MWVGDVKNVANYFRDLDAMSSSVRSLRPGGGKPWLGLAAPLAGQEDLGVLALQPEVARKTSPWQLL